MAVPHGVFAYVEGAGVVALCECAVLSAFSYRVYAQNPSSGSADRVTRSPLIGARDGPISQLMVKSSATLVKKRVEGGAFPYPQGNNCLIAGVNRLIATMGLAIDRAPGVRATVCVCVCRWRTAVS